jgi:opacity protein-like surface antigen
MKKLLTAFSALALGPFLGAGLGPGSAFAADMPVAYQAPPVIWSWTGFYLGGHVGAGFGSSVFSDPAGPPIYGGTVPGTAALGGGQVGYNWQIPNTKVVLGVETDADVMSSNGTGTCLASSGFFISSNCRVRPDAGGSFTGRIGLATGTAGRTLLYVKGGGAWLDEHIDITPNDLASAVPSTFDGVQWGWTVGAGLERALTPAWSLRLEYDYAKFGNLGMSTPASFLQVAPPLSNGYVATAGGTSNISQSMQTVKVGLNYKLGEDLHAQWQPPASDYHLRGTADAPYVPDAEIEVGGRTWYSSSRFQKDLGASPFQTQPGSLVSRLTYDSTAASGEVFARIDTASNIFVKGFIGGGKALSGNMHDEDWLIFNETVPYSNTLSSVTGDLAYGTFDVGYSVFRGPNANVGGFVGFNYYRDNKSAYGCAQIANPNSDCVPPIPNSTLGITEDDQWYSVRVGLNGVVTIADRLKLTADAAYLPYVAFRGADNHLLRTDISNTVSPETGTGQGVQLEAILSYAFTNSFSVGAGGRYWAMWAPSAYTNGFGTPCPCQGLPVSTERYGAFLQASYKFGGLL